VIHLLYGNLFHLIMALSRLIDVHPITEKERLIAKIDKHLTK
jgi:hypothetical protein